MAKEEIQIKIDAAVESANAAKSLGQLRKSLIEIQTLQAEIGDTSGAQFDKLSQASSNASAKLAETRDRIGDIQDKTRTLEGTAVERLTGSFGLLKESILNLDFDKAKIGAEGLLNTFTPVVDGKLVTGLAGVKGAFGMLADGVKSLGSTFMTVGKALLTNPIFLLAAAIIAIIAVVVIIMDKLGILKKVMDALMVPINLIIKGFEMLTDWLGLTTYALEDNADAAKKNGEEQRAQIDATATAQKNLLKLTEGMTEEEIAAFRKKAGIKDALNKSSFDIEKERLTQTQATLKTEIDALNELEAAGGELTDEQKKDLEQRKKDYEANAASIKQVELEKQKAIIDLNKKTTETLQSWKIKNIKDENERAKAQLKLTEADEIRKIDVEIANAKRLGGEALKNVSILESSKKEIKKYFATQSSLIDDAIQKKTDDANKKASDDYKNALQKQLADKEKALQTEINKLKANGATKEEILKKEFDMENALFKFKEDKKILVGKSLEFERSRLLLSQKERQDAFDKGELDSYNKNRQLRADNLVKDLESKMATELNAENLTADQKLEIVKSYDQRLFEAQRNAIITRTEIELANEEKTADEKENIRLGAYLEIDALDKEYQARQNDYVLRDLENQATISQALVDKTEFELEQYNRKVQGVLLLDQKQRDYLISLDMKEQIALNDAMTLELANTELTESQKNEIKERYRQLNIEQQQAADERLKDARIKAAQDDLQIAQQGLTAIQGLTDAFFAFKKRKLEKGSAEELKAAKQQFNTNKALQIGVATVTGIQSVLSAFANGMKNPVPLLGPATAAVYAGIAGITAAANIAKIAATKFEGGGPSPTGDTPSPTAPGAGGGGDAAAVSNFQPNQFFGLGQQTAMGMPGGPKPVKVYVTETDIRDVSDRVSVIEQRAIY